MTRRLQTDIDRPAVSTQRKRGPSPKKTAGTRQALVEAALDVFLETGFSGARMSDVAARAGLAKGTLYLYFETKEALFEGVLQEIISEPVAIVSLAAAKTDEPSRVFLSRVVTPILRDLERTRRAALVRLVVSEGARFPSLADVYRRVVLDPAMEAIEAFARQAIARGELCSDAFVRFPLLIGVPAVLATLWNGIFGRSDTMDAAEVFEAYLDLVFGPLPTALTGGPIRDGR